VTLATGPDAIAVAFRPEAMQMVLPDALLHDTVFAAAVAADPAATLTLLMSAAG
jgi:hypothetical protein